MRGSAPESRQTRSQFCESHSCFWATGFGWALTLALALACGAAAWAGPAEDFRRGQQAFNIGDFAGAMQTLRAPAEAGHAPSQVLLARVLAYSQFDAEAVGWYRKAADQGNEEGAYWLGTMYLNGYGVKQDAGRAYAWFAQAAEKRHTAATLAMADAHIRANRGEIVTTLDRTQAASWLARAADLEHLAALDALAQAYRAGGYGLAADAAKAAEYAAKADAVRKRNAPDKKGRKK